METRWKVLGLVFVTRVALGFQFQVTGSVTPLLVDELQLDYRQAGILVGLFLFAGIFISFPAGFAQRFVADKWLVIFGLVLLGAGGLLSGVSNGYGLIAFGRVISGAGFVFATLYYVKMVSDWFGGKELATAMAILVMSWPVGIAIGQVLHPLIAQAAGFSAAFIVASLYCFFSALTVWWFYQSPIDNVTNANAQPSQQHTEWRLSGYHLKLTLIAALVWALFNAVYVIYLSFIVEVLQSHGYSDWRSNLTGSIPSWIMIVTAIAAGSFVDRTGKRDLVLYAGLLLAAGSLVLIASDIGVLINILLLGTIGFGCAGVIMSLTSEAMPAESRAFGMGIFFTLYFVVGLPAPGVAGWLYDLTGNVAAPLIFASVLSVIAAGCNFWFRTTVEKRRQGIV